MRLHLGIRWKVLAVLALPVVVLAGAAGAASSAALEDARTAARVGALAADGEQFARVAVALQAERALSLPTPGPTGVDRLAAEHLAAARAASDREISALTRAVTVSGITSLGASADSVLDRSTRAHTQLLQLRRLVDGESGSVETVAAGYAEVIAADVDLPGAIGELLADRDLGRRLADYTVLGQAAEATSQARLSGLSLLGTTAPTPAQQRDLEVALARGRAAVATFRSRAARSQDIALQGVSRSQEALETLAATALGGEGTGVDAGVVDAATWTATADQQELALRQIARTVAEDASTQASRLAEDERLRSALVGGTAVALVGLMVLLALMQSRRIATPLRVLATAANRTREELPAVVAAMSTGREDPARVIELPSIDVSSRDEVGQVAEGFRDVQSTVLEIAREQALLRSALAETFVNVARRNQVLLARQLSFIDTLERTEEDPTALENLFRLDHLATRMRRNAESLLVLAGIEPGRRVRGPMPLSDVIRTAIGEIEHYDRVRIVADVDPPVVAHLALSAAHLIAELIENATTFSDPGTQVSVLAVATLEGVRVTVTDKGLGMTFEEISEANQRLGVYSTHAPSGAEAVGSQRLGLFVVARLAAKLDARVQLMPGAEGGTVALVDLPPVLFVPGTLPAVFVDGAELADAISWESRDDDSQGPDESDRPSSASSFGDAVAGAASAGGGLGSWLRIDVTALEEKPSPTKVPESEARIELHVEEPPVVQPPAVEPPSVERPPAEQPAARASALPSADLGSTLDGGSPMPWDGAADDAATPAFEDLLSANRWTTASTWSLATEPQAATEQTVEAPAELDPAAQPSELSSGLPRRSPAQPLLAAEQSGAGERYDQLGPSEMLSRRTPSGEPSAQAAPPREAAASLAATAHVPEPQPGPALTDLEPALRPPAWTTPPLSLTPQATMDVLPRQVPRNGFSLGRLGRRGRDRDAERPDGDFFTDRGAASPVVASASAAPARGTSPGGDRGGSRVVGAPPNGRGLSLHRNDDAFRTSSTGARSPSGADDSSGTGPADRLRSALASQALAELSLLSTYRPAVDVASAPSLVRRTPAPAPPAAPPSGTSGPGSAAAGSPDWGPGAEVTLSGPTSQAGATIRASPTGSGAAPQTLVEQRQPRTPDNVRAMLAGFTRGVARARAHVEAESS